MSHKKYIVCRYVQMKLLLDDKTCDLQIIIHRNRKFYMNFEKKLTFLNVLVESTTEKKTEKGINFKITNNFFRDLMM